MKVEILQGRNKIPIKIAYSRVRSIQFNPQMPRLKKNLKLQQLVKKPYFDISKIPFLKLIMVSIFLNLICILGIFIARNNIPPQVPLYYGYARGDKQLSSSSGLVLPSLIAIGIIITNTTISLFINSDYLKKALIISSLLVTVLSLITTVKIMLLVGSF
jgi:hypothetical protein